MNEYDEGKGVLEELLEAYGEEALIEFICFKAGDRVSLVEIGKELRVPYPVLWGWMCDEVERLTDYESALRGVGDQIVHEMLEISDSSGDAKLRIDARKWLASRWDRGRFGENVKVEVNHSVGLISLLSSLPKLIEGEVVDVEALEAPCISDVPVELREDVEMVKKVG